MKYTTFSKHVKFREEKDSIFICDCKRLFDFKVDLDFHKFLKRLNCGVVEDEITDIREGLLLEDFKKTGLLSTLAIKQLEKDRFKEADELLENELYLGNRPRTYDFLYGKFKKFPKFFIAAFLDGEIIGVVQGFPREDYLLMGELGVKSFMRKREIGTKLVKEFENNAKKEDFKKIKVGSADEVIGFYLSMNYKPSLFLQFEEKNLTNEKKTELEKYEVISTKTDNGIVMIELEVKSAELNFLNDLKMKLKPLSVQYLFTKHLLL